MFDFAEARLQVHGSNETENDDLENLHEKHEENDRKVEKGSREILYRLGSILWKKILERIMVSRIPWYLKYDPGNRSILRTSPRTSLGKISIKRAKLFRGYKYGSVRRPWWP